MQSDGNLPDGGMQVYAHSRDRAAPVMHTPDNNIL